MRDYLGNGWSRGERLQTTLRCPFFSPSQNEGIASTVTSQKNSVQLDGLRPEAHYVVQVRARTVAGYGQYSHPAEFQTTSERGASPAASTPVPSFQLWSLSLWPWLPTLASHPVILSLAPCAIYLAMSLQPQPLLPHPLSVTPTLAPCSVTPTLVPHPFTHHTSPLSRFRGPAAEGAAAPHRGICHGGISVRGGCRGHCYCLPQVLSDLC